MKLVLFAIVAVLIVGGVLLVAAPQGTPRTVAPTVQSSTPTTFTASTPTVGIPVVAPTMIVVNASTTVTVSIQITDPSLIPNSVNLLRLSSTGAQPTILGQLPCNTSGNCTAQFTLNEQVAGQIQLQVSAAFRGLLKRIQSPTIVVPVWNVQNTGMGLLVAYPPAWQTASLRPLSDPRGVGGIEVIDPSDDSLDQSGIAITVNRNTSVASIANTLNIATLRNQYTQTLGSFSWSVFVFDSASTQLTVVVALAQKGSDVVRLGGDYSTTTLAVMNGIMSFLQ